MGASQSNHARSPGFMINPKALDRSLPILQLFHYEAEVQGLRPSMEDESCSSVLDPIAFPHIAMYAIFDGHGGKECARYARKHLGKHITKQLMSVVQRIAADFKLDPRTGEPLSKLAMKQENDGKAPASSSFVTQHQQAAHRHATPSIARVSNGNNTHISHDINSTVDGGVANTSFKGQSLLAVPDSKEFKAAALNAGNTTPTLSTRGASFASTLANSQHSNVTNSLGDSTATEMLAQSSDGSTLDRRVINKELPASTVTIPCHEAEDINDLWYRSVNLLQLGSTAIASAFADCDQAWFEGKGAKLEAGCTAVVVLIDTVNSYLLCLNAGDARAFLSRKGKCISLTKIHSPTQPLEKARILEATGAVINGRLNGILAVSRALGDRSFKRAKDISSPTTLLEEMRGYPNSKYIPSYDVEETGRNPWTFACSSQPDYATIGLSAALGDEFVLLACDGLFDVMTEEEVISFIKGKLEKIPRRTSYLGVTTPILWGTENEPVTRMPSLHRDLSHKGILPELSPWPNQRFENQAQAKADLIRTKSLKSMQQTYAGQTKGSSHAHTAQNEKQVSSQPVLEMAHATPARRSSTSSLAPLSLTALASPGGTRRQSVGGPSTLPSLGSTLKGEVPIPSLLSLTFHGTEEARNSPKTPRTPEGSTSGKEESSCQLSRALSFSGEAVGVEQSSYMKVQTSSGIRVQFGSSISVHNSQSVHITSSNNSADGSRSTTPQNVRNTSNVSYTPPIAPSRAGMQVPSQISLTPTGRESPSTFQRSTSFSSPLVAKQQGSYPNLQLSLPSSASRPRYTTYSNSTSLGVYSATFVETQQRSSQGSPGKTPDSPILASKQSTANPAKYGLVTVESLMSMRRVQDSTYALGEIIADSLLPGTCLCGKDAWHSSNGHVQQICEASRRSFIQELGMMPPSLISFALNSLNHHRGFKMNPIGTSELWSSFGMAEYDEYNHHMKRSETSALESIADEICAEALQRGTRDNVSVTIVFLGFPLMPPIHGKASK